MSITFYYFVISETPIFYFVNCTGPDNWPGICVTGKMQSPINIETESAIRSDLGALRFNKYDFAFHAMLVNNGHSGK